MFFRGAAAIEHLLNILGGEGHLARCAAHVHGHLADLFCYINRLCGQVADIAAHCDDKSIHRIAHPVLRLVNGLSNKVEQTIEFLQYLINCHFSPWARIVEYIMAIHVEKFQ